MCKIIDFNSYRKEMAADKVCKGTERRVKYVEPEMHHPFVTEQWYQEYERNGWGLSKLIAHIIAQHGYINFYRQRTLFFEDVKMDTTYHEMHPEIKNKRWKAPLWVKISGEWYFIEFATCCADSVAFAKKWAEVGNYEVKGFEVGLHDINRSMLKRFLAEGDVASAARAICKQYEKGYCNEYDWSECVDKVTFDRKKDARVTCAYKLLEFELHEYAVVEVTETDTGKGYVALLSNMDGLKGRDAWFKQKYRETGMPLLYGKWYLYMENWKSCLYSTKLCRKLDRADSRSGRPF